MRKEEFTKIVKKVLKDVDEYRPVRDYLPKKYSEIVNIEFGFQQALKDIKNKFKELGF